MKAKSFSAILALLLLLVFGACQNPSGGSFVISITNSINERTLLPSIDMNTASYTVIGSGLSGASFPLQSTTAGSLTVNSLAFGDWTITVNALNPGGSVIGSGQASATVHTGVSTPVSITVTPLGGNGTLSLAVSWSTSQVEVPSITASLVPRTGSSTSLGFPISDPGSGSQTQAYSVPAGYQTLISQLLDNNIAVMGAVEVVRIVAGQTTSGIYAFTNVKQPGGSVQVNITPAMADPIPVSISGVASTITAGTSITATASVSDGTTNLVYVWYLNGVSQATGPIDTFGSTLAAGYYRLDATAYAANGTRAGGATANFTVVPMAGSIVLYYTYTTSGGTWTRSSSPVTLTNGTNTVSQSLNPDGSVTVTIQNAPAAYEDNGFYFPVGSLQNLKSLRVVAANGSGPLSANLYMDVDNNGEFFTWASNVLAGLGADKYFLSNASPVNGVLTIDSTTSFGGYTLPQLRAGAVAGVSGSTRAAIWLGFSSAPGTSQTTTIDTIAEN